MGGKVGGGGTVIKILTEKNISQGHDVLSCKHDELTWDRIKIKTRIRDKQIKGTVNVISSDPPCKDDNARFTTVPLKLCLIKYESVINVYVSLTCLFHMRFLGKNHLRIFLDYKKQWRNSEVNLDTEKRQYFPHFWSD